MKKVRTREGLLYLVSASGFFQYFGTAGLVIGGHYSCAVNKFKKPLIEELLVPKNFIPFTLVRVLKQLYTIFHTRCKDKVKNV